MQSNTWAPTQQLKTTFFCRDTGERGRVLATRAGFDNCMLGPYHCHPMRKEKERKVKRSTARKTHNALGYVHACSWECSAVITVRVFQVAKKWPVGNDRGQSHRTEVIHSPNFSFLWNWYDCISLPWPGNNMQIHQQLEKLLQSFPPPPPPKKKSNQALEFCAD